MADEPDEAPEAQAAAKFGGLIPMVPYFEGKVNGLTVKNFFKLVENAAAMGRWTDEEKVRVAKSRMMGAACLFALSGDVNDINDYSEFRELVIRRFHCSQAGIKMRQFDDCRQEPGEDPQTFALRLQTIGDNLFADQAQGQVGTPGEIEAARVAIGRMINNQLLHKFLGGLQGALRNNVRLRDPETFQEAVGHAVKEAENLKLEMATKSKVFAVDVTPAPLTMELSAVIARLASLEEKLQARSAEQKPHPQGRGNFRQGANKPKTCWVCDKPGHLSYHCDQQPRGRGRGGNSGPPPRRPGTNPQEYWNQGRNPQNYQPQNYQPQNYQQQRFHPKNEASGQTTAPSGPPQGNPSRQ
jgi:hypothetical protein